MAIKSLNELSYEWLRVLKYNYAKKNTTFNLNSSNIDNHDDRKSTRSFKSGLTKRTSKSSRTVDSKKFAIKNLYENFAINQMQFAMNYDFEYCDLSAQLAVTPQTERCFLNLTAAMSTLQAGCLTGSDNVGKQQTINQLANACGQHLQEINCDGYLTSQMVTWYVKGLASSGSWVLFNKMDKLAPSKL